MQNLHNISNSSLKSGGNVTQIKGNRMYVTFTSKHEEPAFGVYELQ